MPDTSPKSAPAVEPATHEEQSATPGWRPRNHDGLQSNTNPFENFDISGSSVLDGGSVTKTITIRDATEDTAPLQGSKDISDDDYLGSA